MLFRGRRRLVLVGLRVRREPYVDSSEMTSGSHSQLACLDRQIIVPGLSVDVVGFDSRVSEQAYFTRESHASADGSGIVLHGDVPSVYSSRTENVRGVEGANLYCYTPQRCSSWTMSRVFPSCDLVVLDMSFWQGEFADRDASLTT